VLLRAGFLREALLRAGLLREGLFADARRLVFARDFVLAAAFNAAFLFRVRAAFLAASLRLAFDVAIALIPLKLV
jgi:hypothetical protein